MRFTSRRRRQCARSLASYRKLGYIDAEIVFITNTGDVYRISRPINIHRVPQHVKRSHLIPPVDHIVDISALIVVEAESPCD